MKKSTLTKDMIDRINLISSYASEKVRQAASRAVIIASDGEREIRLEQHLCLKCHYYGGGFAGQAFTDWSCKLCGKLSSHPNTAVPKLCSECADAYDLCSSCCGDIDMRHRSKQDNKPKVQRKRS